MDVTDITPQLDQLDVDLDQLEEALKPLLGDLSDISSRLPLLDKSKLNVLIAYAIESILFSSLRLNGVDAKNHAIFTELTRVRQYFDKIKKIETPPVPEQRETRLDTQAAIRFVRADLADNKVVKEQLTEQLAKAKAALQAAKAEKKRQAEEGSTGAKDTSAKRSKKEK